MTKNFKDNIAVTVLLLTLVLIIIVLYIILKWLIIDNTELFAVIVASTIAIRTIRKQTENTQAQIKSQQDLEAKKLFISKKDTTLSQVYESRRSLITLVAELENNSYLSINYFSPTINEFLSRIITVEHNLSEYFAITPELKFRYLYTLDLIYKIINIKDEGTFFNAVTSLPDRINPNDQPDIAKYKKNYTAHLQQSFPYFFTKTTNITDKEKMYAEYKMNKILGLMDCLMSELIPQVTQEIKNHTKLKIDE